MHLRELSLNMINNKTLEILTEISNNVTNTTLKEQIFKDFIWNKFIIKRIPAELKVHFSNIFKVTYSDYILDFC